MGEVGLEPTKPLAADLQSAPFAARDTPPFDAKIGAKTWITFVYRPHSPLGNAKTPGPRTGWHAGKAGSLRKKTAEGAYW